MSTVLSRTRPPQAAPCCPPRAWRLGRRRRSRMVGTGRLIPPVGDGRGDDIHSPGTRRCCSPRSAVRFRGTGGRRHEVQRRVVAGRPAPRYPPNFSCKDGNVWTCLLSAREWCGTAGLARRTRAVCRPQVDTIAAARYVVSRTERRNGESLRPAEDGRTGGRGASVRWACRRGPQRVETLASDHFARRVR